MEDFYYIIVKPGHPATECPKAMKGCSEILSFPKGKMPNMLKETSSLLLRTTTSKV